MHEYCLQGEGRDANALETIHYTYLCMGPKPLTGLDVFGDIRHLSSVDCLIHLYDRLLYGLLDTVNYLSSQYLIELDLQSILYLHEVGMNIRNILIFNKLFLPNNSPK